MDLTACYNHIIIQVFFFLISTIDPTLDLGDVRVDESGNDSQAISFSRLSVRLFGSVIRYRASLMQSTFTCSAP